MINTTQTQTHSRAVRVSLFAVLFLGFLLISFYALLNAGDEVLAPQSIAWLQRRPNETSSTLRGAELAASLNWKTQDSRPAGEAMVAELKLADRLEGQERLDAIEAIAKKYVRTELKNPTACHLTYFCEGSEREAALRELEVIRPTLTLYREMIKQEGLSYDVAAAPGAPDLTNNGLLNLHRFDLIDLSLNVDKNSNQVVNQLVERAAFWKRIAGEDTVLVRKLVALSNLNSLSTFAREWVLRDLEKGGNFAAKAALLSKMQDLRTDVSPQASRKMMEPSFAREFQMVAGLFDVLKEKPKNYDEYVETDANPDAKQLSSALGRSSLIAGFQTNRTLNLLQKVFEEAMAPDCFAQENANVCSGALGQLLQRGFVGRLQNPTGRKLLAILSEQAMQSSLRAHQALLNYNSVLDRIAEALEQPGLESIQRLKSASASLKTRPSLVAGGKTPMIKLSVGAKSFTRAGVE
jgi:hypothetical protein